jgi:hypothetical protein
MGEQEASGCSLLKLYGLFFEVTPVLITNPATGPIYFFLL